MSKWLTSAVGEWRKGNNTAVFKDEFQESFVYKIRQSTTYLRFELPDMVNDLFE